MIVLFVVLGFVLIALRRWRHLFTFLACMAVLQLVGEPIWEAVARPRPFDVTIIGEWAGYSLPPPVLAFLTLLVVAIVYTLVVPGRPRTIAKVAGAVVVGVYAAAELYLATVHPFDVAVGVTMAVALGVTAFRLFTPNEIFPVTYGGGKKAHLDVGGERGEAIRRALQEQLGLTVVDLKPVGLAGSGGSTPLRLRVAGDPDTYLFGKLYAMSHVRADRWYKLGRTVIYGRLEDEAPFSSVRRLVQYEDYTLRLFCDYGILTAAPYGIVELTPEREYLLVAEFFDGAKEIGDPELEIDDEVIDNGLTLIRTLWDAGLAHRDIKPANLLVRDKQVLVIDVAFAQVRPSPWRQAIDLANMMLVLAVRTDSQRVYDRALQFFTPDEIAEAFAAARGVASPSQLRSVMKQDGRDLIGEFRALAPQRQPIALQRWSAKRVLTIAALAAGAALDHLRAHVRTRTRERQHGRDQQEPLVRHEQHHDPHGADGADGDVGAVRREPPGGLGGRGDRGGERRRAVLARLSARGQARGRSGVAAAGGVFNRRGDRGAERRGRHASLRASRTAHA